MGRGRDTLQLCQLVGPEGLVHAFDVQEAAFFETRALLEREGVLNRARLHLLGHERMAEVAPQGLRLVAFNLGWLPGGDKASPPGWTAPCWRWRRGFSRWPLAG